jgi:hypothetical protein
VVFDFAWSGSRCAGPYGRIASTIRTGLSGPSVSPGPGASSHMAAKDHDQFPIYGTQDHGMVSTMGLVIAGSETSAVVSGAV